MAKEKKIKVNIDLIWSQQYILKATSIPEAKKKAWEKFKKNIPKKSFSITGEHLDE